MFKTQVGITTWLLGLLTIAGGVMAQESIDNLKAYPSAEVGMTRFVLHLDPQADEEHYRIQLLVGQTVETDERNRYFFAGELVEKTVEGWGFGYYYLKELGPMAGTLIGLEPDAPKVKRFISLGGEPPLFRYNSRLPVVVYVPTGCEVRYRIWKAEPESKSINPG